MAGIFAAENRREGLALDRPFPAEAEQSAGLLLGIQILRLVVLLGVLAVLRRLFSLRPAASA